MHPDKPSDPDRRYVEFGGEQIAYTTEGDGPTVLAVHGLPGSARDFRWIATAFSNARFIRVELPGYGESTRSGFVGMNIATRADTVMRVADRLRIEHAALIAHSAGGVVAAHLAARHPERFTAVALIACPGPYPHPAIQLTRRLASILESKVARTLALPVQRGLYRLAGFSSSLSDDVRTYTSLDAAAQSFDDHRHNLQAMTQPTLTAWAADDRMIPNSLFEALEELVPAGPRLRFDRGGHNVQKTMATEIAREFEPLLGP